MTHSDSSGDPLIREGDVVVVVVIVGASLIRACLRQIYPADPKALPGFLFASTFLLGDNEP